MPVTRIEKIKVRIESTLEKAKALAELRTQTEALELASEKLDYDAAATIIERQKNVRDICIIDNEETKEFEKHKQVFLNAIMTEYEGVIKNKAVPKIKSLAKILCKIDKEDYAGEKYLNHINEEIKIRCDTVLKNIIALLWFKKQY